MEGELLEVGKEVTVTYDLYRQIRYVLDRKLLVGEKYANGGLKPLITARPSTTTISPISISAGKTSGIGTARLR